MLLNTMWGGLLNEIQVSLMDIFSYNNFFLLCFLFNSAANNNAFTGRCSNTLWTAEGASGTGPMVHVSGARVSLPQTRPELESNEQTQIPARRGCADHTDRNNWESSSFSNVVQKCQATRNGAHSYQRLRLG